MPTLTTITSDRLQSLERGNRKRREKSCCLQQTNRNRAQIRQLSLSTSLSLSPLAIHRMPTLLYIWAVNHCVASPVT